VRVGFHLTVFEIIINRTTGLNKNNKEISDNSQSPKIRTTKAHQHCVVVNVVVGLFYIIYYYCTSGGRVFVKGFPNAIGSGVQTRVFQFFALVNVRCCNKSRLKETAPLNHLFRVHTRLRLSHR